MGEYSGRRDPSITSENDIHEPFEHQTLWTPDSCIIPRPFASLAEERGEANELWSKNQEGNPAQKMEN